MLYSLRVGLAFMRQAKALLIILALLSTPLALFGAVRACAPVTCAFCAGMSHGNTGGMAAAECPMNKKAPLPDAALASPLAPTAPLPFFQMAAPAVNRGGFLATFEARISFGFLALPFIPPRS